MNLERDRTQAFGVTSGTTKIGAPARIEGLLGLHHDASSSMYGHGLDDVTLTRPRPLNARCNAAGTADPKGSRSKNRGDGCWAN